ncbi:MAG: nicotinamide mononucleotide transporter [Anaerolineales bacterium]|nr:nicotinamide mononucleotide transporter [Anaerolineales bacterium]
MLQFFSVNTVAFDAFGYPLSYLELIGTIFNLWSVWLVTRRRIETWPVGLVGIAFFLLLFYQIRLYADVFEQIYFFVASVVGWWRWGRAAPETETQTGAAYSPRTSLLGWAALTALGGAALGVFVSRAHLLLPDLFQAPAAYPYLDALTTAMSFSATWLMAQKRTEHWLYWISVDVIGIGLYFAQGAVFVAGLYVVFLFLAIRGWLVWRTVRPVAQVA